MSVEIQAVKVMDEAPLETKSEQEARERLRRGEEIIRDNTLWALGAGAMVLIWPLMDVVAATAVQLKMLKNLSELYGVKFTKGLGVKVVGAVVMGSGGALVGDEVMVRALSFVPGIGTALGAVSTPLVAAAFAHALGRMYLVHLDAGGALLDFDAAAIREGFKAEFEKSKQTVAQVLKDKRG